jgi:hypothetical protein
MSKGLWDVDWMRCGCCGGAIGVSSSLCCCAAYVVWGYCMVVVGSRKHGMHDYLLHPFVDHASPYAYAVG